MILFRFKYLFIQFSVVLALIPFPGPPLDQELDSPKIVFAIYNAPISEWSHLNPSKTIPILISSVSSS